MNRFHIGLLAPTAPMTNNELTAKRAQDSTSMVMMALHNPSIPVIPRAVRVFLVCRMSRITIMRVSTMLSESEIEKYERLDQVFPFVGFEYW